MMFCNRRFISLLSNPKMSTTLSRELKPRTIFTSARVTCRQSANSAITAALAFPLVGETAIRTRTLSPCQPAISERGAPGWTRSSNLDAVGSDINAGNQSGIVIAVA